MNWRWWRRMWRVKISRYLLHVCTPWFLVEIRTGTGEDESLWWYRWHGIRVHWGHKPKWDYLEGEIMFDNGDITLGPVYYPRQREL